MVDVVAGCSRRLFGALPLAVGRLRGRVRAAKASWLLCINGDAAHWPTGRCGTRAIRALASGPEAGSI